jgi:hypothetical protein
VVQAVNEKVVMYFTNHDLAPTNEYVKQSIKTNAEPVDAYAFNMAKKRRVGAYEYCPLVVQILIPQMQFESISFLEYAQRTDGTI